MSPCSNPRNFKRKLSRIKRKLKETIRVKNLNISGTVTIKFEDRQILQYLKIRPRTKVMKLCRRRDVFRFEDITLVITAIISLTGVHSLDVVLFKSS